MAFVKEYISEEDRKKYGHTSTWTIDRERGVFLVTNGPDRDLLMEFKLYRLSDKKLISKAFAEKKSYYKNPNSPNPVEAITSSYKITNFFIYEGMTSDSVKPMLEAAILEDRSGEPEKKYPNIEVKTIFSDSLGGAK